jgi:hypothetical protein
MNAAGCAMRTPAFTLNRLDQHRGDTPRALSTSGRQVGALRLDEFVEAVGVLAGGGLARQELVDRVELAPVGVSTLLRFRLPP